EHLGTFALGVIGEARLVVAAIRLEIGGFCHPRARVAAGADAALAGIVVQARRRMVRLIPQKRAFFDLYTQASANAVGIAKLLVDLMERFPQDGDALVRDAVAELFNSTDDAKVIIRWKDIHERLEEAVDALENAADVLEAILVKNR